MTPKQAVSLVNRKAIRPERPLPTFAQVEAFLKADGWSLLAQEFWRNDYPHRVWQKYRTPDEPEPHEIWTPAIDVRDRCVRIMGIMEIIALMKGDRWAMTQIQDTIAKIKVTP